MNPDEINSSNKQEEMKKAKRFLFEFEITILSYSRGRLNSNNF